MLREKHQGGPLMRPAYLILSGLWTWLLRYAHINLLASRCMPRTHSGAFYGSSSTVIWIPAARTTARGCISSYLPCLPRPSVALISALFTESRRWARWLWGTRCYGDVDAKRLMHGKFLSITVFLITPAVSGWQFGAHQAPVATLAMKPKYAIQSLPFVPGGRSGKPATVPPDTPSLLLRKPKCAQPVILLQIAKP
jgi:hypothetical protein